MFNTRYGATRRVKKRVSKRTMGKGQYRKDGVKAGRTLAQFNAPRCSPKNYAVALISPLVYNSGEARVPDLLTIPTQTVTLQLEITQTAFVSQNSSVAGACIQGGVLVLTSNGPRYYSELSTGTTTSLDTAITPMSVAVANSNTWAGDTASGNCLLPGAYSLINNWRGYRVVAAGLQVEFIGNDANNQGQITSCNITSVDATSLTSQYLQTENDLENFRHNYTGAAKNGTYMRWLPVDAGDTLIGVTSTPAALSSNLRGFNSGASAAGDTRNYGALQWHATGLSTTTPPQFRVSIRVHLEGLVQKEYSGVDTGEVVINPIAQASILSGAAGNMDPRSATSHSAMEVEAREAAKRAGGELPFQSQKRSRGTSYSKS